MAQKRMFSLQIIDTDAFLDMPTSSQVLYFHLVMRADDEGFVGNPKKILRLIGANDDDLKVLITKRFILTFESGVVVIKHWLIHNTIRMDRFNKTTYLKEKNTLFISENKAYTDMATSGIPLGNQLVPQVKLSKVKLSKDRDMSDFNKFWEAYPKKEGKSKCELKWNQKGLDKSVDTILAFIEKAKQTDRWKKGYIKNPFTFINSESWEDDLDSYNDIKKQSETIHL